MRQLSLLAVLCAAPAVAQAPPNILVFIGDDLGWRDLGVYGNPAVHAPNLDGLARSAALRNADVPPPEKRWGRVGPK